MAGTIGSIDLSVITFKLESASGTSAAPTAAADAVPIRVSNLDIKMDLKTAERDVIVGGFSAPDVRPFTRRGKITFSVEAQSSGTPGTAPQIGRILRACGRSEVIVAGQAVEYWPSSLNIPTATIGAVWNGRYEEFVFCNGTVKRSTSVGKMATFDFSFDGLVVADPVVQAGAVTPVLTAWKDGDAVGPVFTPPLQLGALGAVTYASGVLSGGTAYNFESIEVDDSMDVQDTTLASAESMGIYGKNPSVNIVCNLGPAAHVALAIAAKDGTPQSCGYVHGKTAGRIFGEWFPRCAIKEVGDQKSGKKLLDKVVLIPRPLTTNDDSVIFFA
jgi:hypothetical protein